MKQSSLLVSIVFTAVMFFYLAVGAQDIKLDGVDIKYYFGDVLIYSADGLTPYGKTVSLVKRIVYLDKAKIVEIVLQPPRSPQLKPHDITVTLLRINSSNEYLVTADDESFTVKLIFKGKTINWNRWNYQIVLNDGSQLAGFGILDSEGIKTEKTFYNTKGAATFLLKENLKCIAVIEYERMRQKILASDL